MKLTKEDLDKLEAWCNGHSDHTKFAVSMDDLLRLARLGLEQEEKLLTVRLDETQVAMAKEAIEQARLIELGRWAEDHAIEALQYAAKQDQSVASAFAEDALEALPK